MKYFDEELQKHARKVRLKAQERHELRERILTYMEYHPLPKTDGAPARELIESQPFMMVRLNTIYTKVAAGVFTLLVVIGVPMAAERSVPGDVLYPVKTQLNEGFRAQFANTPYEKVAFETEMLERRIAEARLLAKEGKLTDEVEAKIAETVKGHADAAQEGIVAIKIDNADEGAIAEIAFASALDIQTAVLETDTEKQVGTDTGTDGDTEGIASAVRAAQAVSKATQTEGTPSFDGLMARVEQETTRAYELFANINGAATDDERAQIERRLEDVERSIVGARGMQASGADGSIGALRKALALTQKLIVFMTDIDVRESVELEKIVPVELTDEEISESLLVRYTTLETQWETLIPTTTIEVSEKVQFGIDEVNDLFGTATTAIALNQFAVADEALLEIEKFISDIDSLLNPVAEEEPADSGEPVVEETPTETETEEPVVVEETPEEVEKASSTQEVVE